MRLLTVIFPSGPATNTDYPRLLAALRRSVAANSPGTPLDVVEVGAEAELVSDHPSASATARESFVANTRKMKLWQEAVDALPDGEVLALIDADTIVLRDLSDAVDLKFEVTYTARPEGSRFPINSGVVLARGGSRTRSFFRRWRAVNEAMLADPTYHQEHRARWGGINQAALGAMIADPGDVELVRQECAEWNCEDTTWHLYDPAITRIAHIKGRLRRVCLRDRAPDSGTRALHQEWRRYDERRPVFPASK